MTLADRLEALELVEAPMSDWQVGDLAVCVGPLDHNDDQRGMFKGHLYRVTRVVPQGLILDGADLTGWAAWKPECFRKIRPDEHQACEEEFVKLLRRSKRKVSA